MKTIKVNDSQYSIINLALNTYYEELKINRSISPNYLKRIRTLFTKLHNGNRQETKSYLGRV